MTNRNFNFFFSKTIEFLVQTNKILNVITNFFLKFDSNKVFFLKMIKTKFLNQPYFYMIIFLKQNSLLFQLHDVDVIGLICLNPIYYT